jgi:parallel beta-helix repeat protein
VLLLVGVIGLYLAGFALQSAAHQPLPVVWDKIEKRWADKYPSVFGLVSPLARTYVGLYAVETPKLTRSIPDPEAWSGRGADPDRELPRPTYDSAGRPLAVDRTDLGQAAAEPLRVVSVSDTYELVDAVQKAEAGDEILIAPGEYAIHASGVRVDGAGTAEHPIVVRAARLGDVRIRFDAIEGFVVTEPFWAFENLDIGGACEDDTRCDHAFHVTGGGRSVLIRNNRLHDFNAVIKVNGSKDDYPDGGLVEGNSIYNTRVRDTRKPVALIDIVAANDWRVDGNVIADFAKEIGTRTASGAFIKGNARGGVLERNLVICSLRVPQGEGARIGLSLGDGGTGKSFCRDRQCPPESTGGVIRNNVIMHCSDVGVYLNRAAQSVVANNLLYNTWGIDARYPETDAVIVNNVFTGRIAERDGGRAESRQNERFKGKGRFADPANGDFSLTEPEWLIDRGAPLPEVEDDYCGRERPPHVTTLGPFQYASNEPGCRVF